MWCEFKLRQRLFLIHVAYLNMVEECHDISSLIKEGESRKIERKKVYEELRERGWKRGRKKNEEEDRKIEKLVTDKILHVLKKYDLVIMELKHSSAESGTRVGHPEIVKIIIIMACEICL